MLRAPVAAFAATLVLVPLLAAPASADVAGADLVVAGDDTVVVEAATLPVAGNVVVKDRATLVLRAATLALEQGFAEQFGVRVLGDATLRLEAGSVLTSNFAWGLTASERGRVATDGARLVGGRMLFLGGASLDAAGASFDRMVLDLRGSGASRLAGSDLVWTNVLRTWDTASLDIRGSFLEFQQDLASLQGSSRIEIRDSTVQGWLLAPRDRSSLLIEDSVIGGTSTATFFVYLSGTPRVTYRNLQAVQEFIHIVRGGHFDIEAAPFVASGNHFDLQTFHSLRVGPGALVNLPAFARVDRLEMAGGQASLLGYRTGTVGSVHAASGTLDLYAPAVFIDAAGGTVRLRTKAIASLGPVGVGATSVDHLLVRAGGRVELVGGAVQVAHLNNECLAGTVAVGVGSGFNTLPAPGVPAPGELDHTLRVRVLDAAGQPVAGAEVRLADALGAPLAVYDPATGAASPDRTAGVDGRATYLFAPTGVLKVAATAPGGAAGSALAAVANCAEVEVQVA